MPKAFTLFMGQALLMYLHIHCGSARAASLHSQKNLNF
jgi:hypothetical protein